MKNLFRKWAPGSDVAPSTAGSAPPPDLRALYQTMLRARCLDEVEADLVARGEAFFHVSGAGHEASAVLNAFLRPEDYLHLHYRDKALMLARGIKPEQFFNSLLCNASSHSLGRQMSAHMSDPRLHILSIVAPVGNNALQAAGVAAVLKANGRQAIVVCSMGDGSSQQGEVLEAIAEAVRASLPVLFFIQDNHYAISTRTRGQTFYSLPDGDAAEFYGLPIHRVDGRDPVASHSKLAPIVASVRAQGKPALVVFEVERLSDHTNADDESRYRPAEETRQAAEIADPIKILARHLLKNGLSSPDLDQIGRKVRGEIIAASTNALATWTAPPAITAKKPLPPSLLNDASEPQGAGTDEGLTMLEAIREVLRQRLAADERVTLYGEDIEDPKGDVFGVTRGLSQSFPGRVMNSALSESTIVGMSVGRALAGGRPVAMIQFADFLPLAFNQILSELGTLYWRTAGGWDCPVIIMAPCGGFRPGLGPFHGQTMESVLAHAPGLDVFMPANATDAAGLLNAAFESGRPTVFLYPKVCLNVRENLAPAAATRQCIPIGKSRFLARGSDLTLVTWGATVPICAKVVHTLRSARVQTDLIDLRSISPWDRDAVCESAERTGTLVVVHEDNLTAGFGAEVVAAVTESVPRKIAVRRITRPDTYVPCRFANQLEILPSFKRILAEVTSFLDLELNWVTPADAGSSNEFVNAIGSSPADRTVTIVAWKIKAGDTVAAGDIIAEVESEEALSELACPTSGTVEEVLATQGSSVPVGTPIIKVRPVKPGERITPTVLLQRGEPVVKRKENFPPPPSLAKATGPKVRPRSGVFAVSPEIVRESTTISDITDDAEWMERARWLTAEAYTALANPKSRIGLEDVYDVVSTDVYETPGRSRTLAALTTDPGTGCSKISGTVRVVLGRHDETQPDVPPIDAMNFVQPTQEWPHRQKGWSDSEIAELGRFFIPERYRTLAMRRAGIDVWLSVSLCERAAAVARSQNVKLIYIIMPPYVARLVPSVPVQQIESRLKLEDPIAASVFEQYSLYWQRADPKLYQLYSDFSAGK